ncbi:1,4-dihydroxy-2-naphthoate octaprenyltransferase [Nocardia transvalensis]|uniref:1,4-dihydroxy-2-naphthoate octaprenyltransferase n=1 Tax=Nocardia transvalensis TaxID=37333 RepID=A0A7W9PKK5_9NOCA|nr:UbiA family prenyltransferase [Nocardia transvalensis]MBB5917413.1 1,4-dihydroxy-2-naphthoate octaprenyltransferase [Nocardia transvalensis]
MSTPLSTGRSGSTTLRKFGYSIRIRRLEFFPVHLSAILTAAFLGAASWSDLGSGPAVAAFVAFVLGVHSGNMANCLADRDMDTIYKSRLATAVDGLGKRNVTIQIAISVFLIVLLVGYMTVASGHWDIAVLGIAWLVIGFEYSLPPLRLKGAGVWQVLTLATTIALIPGVMIIRAIDAAPPWQVFTAYLGYAVSMMMVSLVNQAEDVPEDARFGIRTAVRALGITPAMVLAVTVVTGGATVFAVSAVALDAPWWAVAVYAVVVVLTLRFLTRIYLGVRGKPVEEAVEVIRRYTKQLPLHGAGMGWATVLVAVSIFAVR